LEKLGNLLNKLESNDEQNFSQNQVVLNLRELLVCFVLFTLGLFLSIIVFGLEIIVFLKNRFRETTAWTLWRCHYCERLDPVRHYRDNFF
jgi:hypothetical protein